MYDVYVVEFYFIFFFYFIYVNYLLHNKTVYLYARDLDDDIGLGIYIYTNIVIYCVKWNEKFHLIF